MAIFLVGLAISESAQATFHLMQVEQVIGGVDGDTRAQAIQLRMRAAGQNLVQQAKLVAYDAAGQNPILLVDLDHSVPNSSLGDRVLIASPAFTNYASAPLLRDFTLTNLIPINYLAAGRLTFESDLGTIYWSVSWGGTNYTGSNAGQVTNDSDGNFGPPFPGPLPSTTTSALLFTNSASAASTRNDVDYIVTAGAAVFANNARTAVTVQAPPPAAILDIQVVSTNIVITFLSVPGALHDLERTQNLVSNTWTAVTNNLAGTGNNLVVTDPDGADRPRRFYRVKTIR